MIETWRDVPGYNGIYKASTIGRILTTNWKGTGKTVEIIPSKDANGYLRTVFTDKNGGHKTIKVHRIIAETFIPNGDNKPEINHVNCEKDDNNIMNLEWVTHRENFDHSIKNGKQRGLFVNNEPNRYYVAVLDGRCNKVQGELVGTSKLTETQVNEIRFKFKRRVYTREMLALEYGVTPACIKDVILRKSWKHL